MDRRLKTGLILILVLFVSIIQVYVFDNSAIAATIIGDGTSPSNKNVPQSSENNAVSTFTLQTPSGTDTVTQIVVRRGGTGAASDVPANGVKIYRDNNSNNEWDAGDLLLGQASFSGTDATFNAINIGVTTTLQRYLITYNIAASATVGSTLTGYVSSATAASVTNNDNADATLTITAGCTRINPSVEVVPGTRVIAKGASATYSVRVTNNDTAACSSTSFTLSLTNSPGVPNANFSSSALESAVTGALAPGEIWTTTLTHTATAGAANGSTLQTTVSTLSTANGHALTSGNQVTTTVGGTALGAGDGMLLKRPAGEICHSCHKTDSNAPNDPNSIKMHSAERLGSCSNPAYTTRTACTTNGGTWTTKWGVAGWGITGGQYGAFLCTTCHTSHNTRNIYLIKEAVTAPSGSFPGSAVDFRTMSGSPGDIGTMGDDSAAHSTSTRVCETCHSRNKYHNYDRAQNSVYGGNNTHYNAQDCSSCHNHTNAFAHGAPGTGCEQCHGHDAGYGGVIGGKGTFRSHSTHTENDADDIKGPNIGCGTCHNTSSYPDFADGVTYSDYKAGTAMTTVCNSCHSSGGPYDGINDPVYGAKANWANGVYTGSNLTAGKERWCVTCHDSGVSVIPASGGRQAPDIAGNNTSYGYYVSGHGNETTECSSCHDLSINHNFDGNRTYASASNNYRLGYRLKNIGSQNPMAIPKANNGCGYDANDFALCFSCHSESALLADTQPNGVYECTTNPFKNAASFSTEFRNVSSNGVNGGWDEVHANIHWDHLVDVHTIFSTNFWDSDRNGTNDSKVSCVTCHNPHGAVRLDNTGSTIRMTRQRLDIQWGSDATGTYGKDGPNSDFPCFNCHAGGSEGKYYKTAAAELQSSGAVVLTDSNPNDPSPAETGYTNDRTVQVTLNAWAFPTEMILAENNTFTVNSTGWVPFTKVSTYTLTNSDGTKTVYAKVRNTLGESAVSSRTIVLDRISPTVPASAITSPNGTEIWDQGTSRSITWSGVSDAYLKASPITLKYSTDGGSTYPNTIATNLANTGTYTWNPLPLINSTTVRVQLVATDRAGNQSSDISDNNFTIRAVTPSISSFTASDNNSSDPTPAEVGFTNARTVSITISAANYPVEMVLAEDSGFSQNSTGWITYSTSYTYTLSDSDGLKTIWLKLRNAAGESAPGSFAITLDRIPPAVSANALTAPNGGESWPENSSQTITWNVAQVTDTNIKAAPVALSHSVNSGITYTAIVANEANDGSYTWNPLPKPANFTSRIRLTATDRAGNQSSDDSNADFRITTPYVVTTPADSGAGSLRQIITDLVAAGGNDTIWFDIPSGSLTNGVAVISLAANLPDISAPNIIIDASSQTFFRGDTNNRGPEVRIHGWSNANSTSRGFNVTAAGSTIKGFQITNTYEAIRSSADSTRIRGNHIGFYSDSLTAYTASGNRYVLLSGTNAIVGGTDNTDRNYIAGNLTDMTYDVSGIYVGFGANNSSIINNMLGLLPNGSAMDNGNIYGPIVVSASNCLIQGNQISGGGFGIDNSGATGTIIKGNIFGLYYDGAVWNLRNAQTTPIRLSFLSNGNVVIGGPNRATNDNNLNDSNVIRAQSAGSGYGIYVIHSNSSPTQIYGNFIGTNPEQDEVFSGRIGVYLSGSNARVTKVGGYGAGQSGNVIANMSTRAVHVSTGAAFTDIRNNSFYNNGSSAALSDDAIYLEAGANDWPTTGTSITRPTVTSAVTSSVTVTGIQSGDVVDVYISDYDGSGTEYGEGRTLIGSATANGTSVAVPVSGVIVGQWVTATRTSFSGSAGNTSAFSTNFQVQ